MYTKLTIPDARKRVKIPRGFTSFSLVSISFLYSFKNFKKDQEAIFFPKGGVETVTNGFEVLPYFPKPATQTEAWVNFFTKKRIFSEGNFKLPKPFTLMTDNYHAGLKPAERRSVKFKPGFYSLREVLEKLGGTLERHTVTFDEPVFLTDDLRELLYGNIEHPNVLGKNYLLHLGLEELDDSAAIFDGEVSSDVFHTIYMDTVIFG